MLSKLPRQWYVGIAVGSVALLVVGLLVSSRHSTGQSSPGAPPPPDGPWHGGGTAPPPPPDGPFHGGGTAPPPPPDGPFRGEGTAPPPPPNGTSPGGPGGAEPQSIVTTAVLSLEQGSLSKTGQTLTASRADQSVVRAANGAVLTLTRCQLNKAGGDTSATQSSDFYGLNAGVLAQSGGRIQLTDCTLATGAEGANGVFATGAGSTITLRNVNLTTTGRGSARGLEATFGGTILATNVNLSTVGAHCAALATDRGEGTVSLTEGTLTTSGDGSPAIYSTGNITATRVKMTATGSEAAVIEGKNSITLVDSTLVGQRKCGAMLYQSFSGDAGVGTSVFTMTGGSLTAAVGPLLYCTNTHARVNLTGATLTARSGVLLTAAAGRWGTAGANGADVSLTAVRETLSGNLTGDALSTITAQLTDHTQLRGAVNAEHTAKAVNLSFDRGSTWQVTGTSYLTSLTAADTSLKNLVGNGFTVYYDASAAANGWLRGKTYRLTGGGSLQPARP